MNIPGSQIRPGVALFMVGFIMLTIVGIFAVPHLFSHKKALADIAEQHFSLPMATPTPMVRAVIQKATQTINPFPKPSPHATATPCQPCIQAAKGVLMRYVKAIHDGAGSDDSQERYGNLAVTPQVYSQNRNAYVPNPGADNRLSVQH